MTDEQRLALFARMERPSDRSAYLINVYTLRYNRGWLVISSSTGITRTQNIWRLTK